MLIVLSSTFDLPHFFIISGLKSSVIQSYKNIPIFQTELRCCKSKMFKYTIFLLFVSFAASLAADEDKPEPSILGNTTDLKNVQFFLQNATDMFEKWMNGSNTEAGNQIVNLLKGFLSGGKDDGDKSSDSNNTGSLQNLLKFVEPVIPLFTGKGQVDTNQLMALVSSAITGAEKALTSTGVSRECANDVQQMFYGLQHTQTWALKMIDAAFKIPSGLADYNLKWLGNRDECLTIISDPSDDVTGNKQQFHGKYCRLALPLGNVPNAGEQTLILGACASHRCSNDDVTILVKTVVSQITSGAFSAVYVSCIEDNLELDTGAKAAISILVVLGIMIIMGTLYDVVVIQLSACESSSSDVVLKHVNAPFTDLGKLEGQTNGAFVNEKNGTNVEMKGYAESKTIQPQQNMSSITDPKQNKPKRGVLANILLAFSVYTNGCKLLGTNQGSGTLGAVNGIRFLSMAWVILGHTLFFAFNYGANTGSFGPKKMFQESFMAILYATVSVDSFFALSGTLVAYLTLREIKKVGGPKKLNWFMFYFHRFWRLTPPYMLILMVGTTLYKYVGTGAMKPDGDSYMMAACRDNWWTNIIYLNNYINTDRSCMGWSWYLANDMQLYVLSPLLLVPLFYNKIIGGIISAVTISLAIVIDGVISDTKGYHVQAVPQAGEQPPDNFKNYYIPVWTRFGPYVVGLLTGYVLYKSKCKCKIPKILNITIWIVCLGTICAIIYGPYSDGTSHVFSRAENGLFDAFFRTAWGASICWMIFAGATGNGGWINEVLSWSAFIPLGRLTYCAYLIHPLVMEMYYETRDQPIYFSDYGIIYMFLGNMGLSYGAAFILSLVFESPMMGLEKAIFKKK